MERPPDLLIALRMPARASCLRLLRCLLRDLTELVGLAKAERGNVLVAVNEACMNVIQHGYANDPEGEIRLDILQGAGALIFLLQDDAPSVDKNRVRPRDLADIRPGGLGVHFIRNIMDEVEFLDCSGQGNRLRMVKYFHSER